MRSPFAVLDSPDGDGDGVGERRSLCFRHGEEVEWGVAAGLTARLARALREQGAGRWLVYNVDGLGAAVSLLALARAGGCAVLAPNAQPETLRRLAEGVRGAVLEKGAATGPPGLPCLAPLDPPEPQRAEAPSELRVLDPHALVAELQTSGTSGDGKGVSKELRHLAEEVAVLEGCFGERLGPDVSVFGTVSPQHIYGLLFRVLWPLAGRRPFQADTLLLPQELLPRMCEREPHALVTTPSHLARMVECDAFADLRSGCRAVWSSGAPLPAATREAVERKLGQLPIEILGSTETGGIAWRQGDEDWRAFPGVEVEAGAEGRLLVTSRIVSSGAPAGEGRRRLLTGDRCSIRGPGRFRLAERADRVVKIAGKRLALPVMERELAAHADVAEAALVAVPRAHEPRVRALVVPSEQGRQVLAEQGVGVLRGRLQAHLASRFDRVLLPRAWRFAHALPRDAQGKVTAAAVRACFERRTQPVIQTETREGCALRRRLLVPPDLACLEGHFPGQPVVPGVVALSWALGAAAALLGRDVSPARIDTVKFPTPLLPGQTLELRVEHDAAAGRIRFVLAEGDVVFASGRVTLRAEAAP